MMREFLVSPGPHLWRGQSTSRIMYIVVLALTFPTIAGIYFFGYRALLVMAVSIAVAVLTEYGVKKLRKRPFVMDGSAILTGLLLALTLPPTVPLWMVAIGSVFSIAIVKEAFGGLGHNIFNPALGGRAFMAVSFPVEMTSWVLPMDFVTDAVTTATPLAEGFVWQLDRLELYKAMLLGNIGGSIGETSALLILVGGLLLIALRIIDWRIPLAYIATVALFTFALGQDAIFHVLAGGLMLGAFFMATDYVTSPITHKGRIIFGVGVGLLTVVIRLFGGLPEGVAFSILMMNAVTPLIDRHIKVKPYGLKKEG
ncbi:RnfABCDGE type electron transport complex subunit D [Dehalococcoidia bacterium]|nr:RnfABCDGE type electron transport complex subunit D [Dehalococcoidia bacterium]